MLINWKCLHCVTWLQQSIHTEILKCENTAQTGLLVASNPTDTLNSLKCPPDHNHFFMASLHYWFSFTSQGQTEGSCCVLPHDRSSWTDKWPVVSPRWRNERPQLKWFLSTRINIWWVTLNKRWSTRLPWNLWAPLNVFAWWELFWHRPLARRCKQDATSQTTCWSMHELLFYVNALAKQEKKWKKLSLIFISFGFLWCPVCFTISRSRNCIQYRLSFMSFPCLSFPWHSSIHH